MHLQLRPLTLDLDRLDGLTARLIASHHENNYAGAVKRLAAIRKQLAELDWSAAPAFVVNGLEREELIAANSSRRAAALANQHETHLVGVQMRGVC